MKTGVRITISGAEGTGERHYDGFHLEKAGSHYLFYSGETGPCRVRLSSEGADIHRRGEALEDLRILKGGTSEAVIRQSFGTLVFRVRGTGCSVFFEKGCLRAELSYVLLQGERELTENTVKITAVPSPAVHENNDPASSDRIIL